MIITLCRDENKQSTLKTFWKQWKATWELLFLLHWLAHSTINRLGKNWNQIQLYHSSRELNCVIATLVTALKPDQGSFSWKSWNISGDIKPFLFSILKHFQLWNLAVILPFLTSETYSKSSFSQQADHSFKNCFSGPISHRVFRETAHRSQW